MHKSATGDMVRRNFLLTTFGGISKAGRFRRMAIRLAIAQSKFFQRNRVLGACGFAWLSLDCFAGGLAAAWQRGVAISKEQEARKRFGDIRELANSFLGELDDELERLPGSTTAREMLARRVLKYLDQLAKEEVNDASLQRDLAAAYERLGDVEGGPTVANLGNTQAALDAYGKAIAIFDALGSARPNDAQFIADQTRSYSKMSDFKSVMGDLPGRAGFRDALARVREAWLKEHPEDRPIASRACGQSAKHRRTARSARPL